MIDMAQADKTLHLTSSGQDEGVFDRFRQRGTTLFNEYDIYVAAAKDLGWQVKSFGEWLNT